MGSTDQLRFKYYKQKASEDDVDSQYRLGLEYYNSKSVPKNLDEAKSWLNKAAKGGSDDARQKLQELFHSTKDVDSNCPMPLSHCSFSWDNFEDDTVCKLAQAIGGKCNHIDEARKWIASRSPSDS